MGKPTIRTPEKIEAFLAVLRDGRSVTAAAVAAGIGRVTAYEWRNADEEFAKAWDAAVEEGTDQLEDVVLGRAQETSDTLAIFLLKARRPEKFRDRYNVEMSGPGGKPIQTEEVSARERLASRIASLTARLGEAGGPSKPDGE